MSFERLSQRHKQHPEDLDVTPLLNLLIILLPVLLAGLVFTRMAILPVDLPPAATAQNLSAETALKLGITITHKGIVVNDGKRDVARIPRSSSGTYDYAQLSTVMQTLKQARPDEQRATLMLQADTPYEVLVHAMDAIRMVARPDPANPGRTVNQPLFPNISLGDAPAQAH